MTTEIDLHDLSDVRRTVAADALRDLCGGQVHLPGDPGYDQHRVPWNFAVDQRPAAVAFPRTADEVSALVRRAAEAGLRVAAQSTGHNAGPLAAQGLDDVVVVRTSEMGSAVHDAERGIVRVGGGAVWEPAVEAAAEHGRAVLHGSSPDVGIAGYSLGGGMGWYARKLGLAANSLTAVELVLADGEQVRATAEENRELFWALRGGGGSFGVVTAMEFRSYPIETAYAGLLLWDATHAEAVLRRWAAWSVSAPDEVTTAFRLLRLPAMPGVPEFLAGRETVVIDGAVLAADDRAREIVADLRALRPELDTFERVPATSLVRLHMDPEGGAPGVSDSTVLAHCPDAAVDAFLAEVGPGSESSVLMAELRQLGGALGRPHDGGGVLSQLDGQFVSFAGAIALTPEMAAQGHADAVRLSAALAPFSTGGQYLNFAENAVETRTAYRADAWRQLVGIRSAVDPHGLFVANHRLPRLHEGAPTT